MTCKVGQKVCLWQIEPVTGMIKVLREVIVTITETKTGAPGNHSGTPSSMQSLRGRGDDGKLYEKHWASWPESQTRDYADQWSLAEEGWTPLEAVYVYDIVSRHKGHPSIQLIDSAGRTIKPKGDVVYCEKHDRYSHAGNECLYCSIETRRSA